MSHFIWLYWNNQFFYKTAGCPLLTCYDSFWYAVAFNEQLCLFNKCGFLLTQYCGHKRTKGVFYWSRGGGNYWSAESFTNPLVTITVPRCYLPIHSVIYQSGQNRPKKRSPKPNLFCTFILVHWPNFLRKKNSHFTIALFILTLNKC